MVDDKIKSRGKLREGKGRVRNAAGAEGKLMKGENDKRRRGKSETTMKRE